MNLVNHLHTAVNVAILDANNQELLIDQLQPTGHVQSQLHWHPDPTMQLQTVNVAFWSTPLAVKHIYDVPLNQACRFDINHIHHDVMDFFQLDVHADCQDQP